MPRLFVGLEIPSAIGVQLSGLRGGLPGARWIDVENYHVTLRFIGDIDEPTADRVADILDDIRRRPFPVTIKGARSFGGKKPHSVFACVEPTPDLMALQADIERKMQMVGLPAEQRKFTPHITIARVRGASGSAVANYLGMRGFFRAGPFTAEDFTLLSSRASQGGGPYIAEEVYPLDAPAFDYGLEQRI
ncbi:RNA 2',3'-cyclic phosphodiesterase [Tepidamorphus sp. 3E244]|uniref:RNA 2',3'-cyclic phosphodiesterase n=1 Tax=Tepidamorphus sp. 3E244 TaxID=3385498 RepID=UPI0038FD2AF9